MTGLAHIVPVPTYQPNSVALWLCGIILAGGLMTLQHLFVKYPRGVALARLRFHLSVATLIAVVATTSPAGALSSQPTPAIGLPDLVSYPPIIWFDKLVMNDEGEVQKVLAFDGYLYNIGEGMLDFIGNPQEPDGMKQRIFDGSSWTEVGSATVRYETSDDHNHFHLNAAAEYTLWDEAQTTIVGDSAKIGFCLLDTEQADNRGERFYDINSFNYCEQNNPDATQMRMGISPGWVDTYDANTTLQWVDISNIAPGRYWIGAIIDPQDQVVESNEDNNDTVFSSNKWAVAGYVARELAVQVAGEPIELKAAVYGEVNDPTFVITTPPNNGTLSVPDGVDFFDPIITYWPDAGFDGTDEFAYVVRDSDNYYPLVPAPITVSVDASAPPGTAPSEPSVDGLQIVEPAFGSQLLVAAKQTIQEVPFEVLVSNGEVPESVRWFATGLPGGIFIDESTGILRGIATAGGTGSATITAVAGTSSASRSIDWTVDNDMAPALSDVAPLSSPADLEVDLFVGEGTVNAEYTATGLPPGLLMVSNLPEIAGKPTESGVFEVVVTESVDGVETATTSFMWTIRPKTTPAFPL